MNRFLYLSLLCWVSVSHTAQAEEKGVEVRFLAERIPKNLGKVVLASAEERSEPFSLPMNNLSVPQEFSARTFNILSTELKKSLASVTLPNEGASFVVLLLPTLKDGYTSVVMPYDNPNFKAGDIYLHNNADKGVLGSVGTSKFTLNPGQGTMMSPKGAREVRFYEVLLGVKEEDGNRVLSMTRWPESKHTRFYVFFYTDLKTKLVTYRAVDEFVPEKIPQQP
jgi:hypothetical protein